MFFKFFLTGIGINTILFYSYNNNKSIYLTLNITILSYLLTYNILFLV